MSKLKLWRPEREEYILESKHGHLFRAEVLFAIHGDCVDMWLQLILYAMAFEIYGQAWDIDQKIRKAIYGK
jgi:hypothetical protein